MKSKFLQTECSISERYVIQDETSGIKSECLELTIRFISSGNTTEISNNQVIKQAMTALKEITSK